MGGYPRVGGFHDGLDTRSLFISINYVAMEVYWHGDEDLLK